MAEDWRMRWRNAGMKEHENPMAKAPDPNSEFNDTVRKKIGKDGAAKINIEGYKEHERKVGLNPKKRSQVKR